MQILLIMLIVVFLAFSVLLLALAKQSPREKQTEDKCYEIVSCSTVTKVKRLDLLINALSQIKAIPIKWTHYGDGILMDEIKKMAKDKLRDNIQYEFNTPFCFCET